tara:strand:+ start:71 stop:868 length:798 start_codon:yes stop_codon:yes gene_type:complete
MSQVLRHIDLNRSSVYAEGLVGWWPAGNRACFGSACVLDQSLFGNKGTLKNGALWTHQEERSGLLLDGSNDYGDLTSSVHGLPTDAPFTITMWVYPHTVSASMTMFVHGNSPNGWRVRISSSGQLRFTAWSVKDYDSTGLTLTANTWIFLGFVFDSGFDVLFYADGQTSTVAGTLDIKSPSGPAEIGRSTSAAHRQYFDGLIDDIRIWKGVTFTKEQLDLLRHQTIDGGYGDLAADRPFVVPVQAAGGATVPVMEHHYRMQRLGS